MPKDSSRNRLLGKLAMTAEPSRTMVRVRRNGNRNDDIDVKWSVKLDFPNFVTVRDKGGDRS